MKLKIPAAAGLIIEELKSHGYEAYVVGGCVRDRILGREPDDWDITTSASPYEVKQIFRRTVDTGLQHGTVTVMIGSTGYEVTTYRIDGDYEDGRHPKEVTFTRNLEEDLKRRDFTINAMAYNDEDGLVDLFDGMGDLQRKRIRCVGVARDRFQEDALRLMRAVRFAAQLDFSIEEETYGALSELAPNLKKISAERIATELTKLLVSSHPEYIEIARRTGMTAVFLPELDAAAELFQQTPHHMDTVCEHTLKTLMAVPGDRTLRLAALLHDLGKLQTRTVDEEGMTHFPDHEDRSAALARKILKRLKFDNHTISDVSALIRYHGALTSADPVEVRRLMSAIGRELFPHLLELGYGDVMGQSDYRREEKLALLDAIRLVYEDTMRRQDPLSIKDLAVDGGMLIKAGVPAGPQLGALLKDCLDLVLEHPEMNTREALMEHLSLRDAAS